MGNHYVQILYIYIPLIGTDKCKFVHGTNTFICKYLPLFTKLDFWLLLGILRRYFMSAFKTHWGRDKMNAISQTTFSKRIFLNEKVWVSLKIPLKFVTKVRISNIPALAQIMAGRWLGDKLLSEPMFGRSLTLICVIRPQWIKPVWHIYSDMNTLWYQVSWNGYLMPLLQWSISAIWAIVV